MGEHDPAMPTGRLGRTVPLAGFAARTAGDRVLAALRQRTGDPGATDAFHQRTAERYADLLGNSKGVLMKAGQLLSFVDIGSGSDSTFAVYQAALERLQADAPPMGGDTARSMVERELGRPVDAVFARFDEAPLAAASIGQVHEAEMPDGRRVAVKVQYPGVAQAIRSDLANNELLATFLQLGTSLGPRLSRIRHRPAAREISERISEEIDYRHEAGNIDRFAELYRDHPFIRVPETVPEASTERVLTMTYVDGIAYSEAQACDQALKDRWGEIVYRFAVGSYRIGDLFNGDPHPGNYRFGLDGTVGFVDFGCVKRFPMAWRRLVRDIIRATLERDGARLRALFVDGGFLPPATDLTGDELVDWYHGSLASLTGPQPFTFDEEHAAAVTARMYDPRGDWRRITRQFDVPPEFVFTTRIDLGMNSVLAGLRATGHWRAVIDELDGVAPAVTELGREQASWAARRGMRVGS